MTRAKEAAGGSIDRRTFLRRAAAAGTALTPAGPGRAHGHFFRVGRTLKETVLVPGHMGRLTFEFTADNPGDGFFHCHNLYHLEAGMARVFRYAS